MANEIVMSCVPGAAEQLAQGSARKRRHRLWFWEAGAASGAAGAGGAHASPWVGEGGDPIPLPPEQPRPAQRFLCRLPRRGRALFAFWKPEQLQNTKQRPLNQPVINSWFRSQLKGLMQNVSLGTCFFLLFLDWLLGLLSLCLQPPAVHTALLPRRR